jgi:CRP/FNR family transcriptional regulator, anaerobic regulatory protein
MGTANQNGLVPCHRCPLRSLKTFSNATDAEIAFIQSFKKHEIAVDAGGTILPEGGRTGQLYTLLAGMAFRYRTLRDGRRQILNFIFPGDLIGLQEQIAIESPHGVEALSSVKLCTFPQDRLWDLYRNHPQLGYDITWLAAHEESIVDDNLLSVGRRSASERVAMLLIHVVKRAEAAGLCEDNSVPFPLNQQHIADALGLSLVHTNKTLRRLEKLGLHSLENNRLRLLKPAVLKRLADYYALPLRPRPLV